jgi:hypothetical protein
MEIVLDENKFSTKSTSRMHGPIEPHPVDAEPTGGSTLIGIRVRFGVPQAIYISIGFFHFTSAILYPRVEIHLIMGQ